MIFCIRNYGSRFGKASVYVYINAYPATGKSTLVGVFCKNIIENQIYQYSKDWGAGCKDPSFASEGFCWETMRCIIFCHGII